MDWRRGPSEDELPFLAHGPVVLARAVDVVAALRGVYVHTDGLLLPIVIRARGGRARDLTESIRARMGLGGGGELITEAFQLDISINGRRSAATDLGGGGGGGNENSFTQNHLFWIDQPPGNGTLTVRAGWETLGLPVRTTRLELAPAVTGRREVVMLFDPSPTPPALAEQGAARTGHDETAVESGLPPAQAASVVLERGGIDTESLTLVLVAGAAAQEVAATLGADLLQPVEEPDWPDEAGSGYYRFLDIAGGALAAEFSGYADPSLTSMRALSAEGRRAAVVRRNIQAHVRFGCAVDSQIVFDDDEYMFTDDPDQVPAELQALFRLTWTDLSAVEDNEEDDHEDPVGVALAMATTFTGLALGPHDLARLADASAFLVTGQSIFDS